MLCCISDESQVSVNKCIAKQIGTRADHFLSAIDETVKNLALFIVGSSYALTSLASLGLHSHSVKNASEALYDGGGILRRLYFEALKILNPSANINSLWVDSATTQIDEAIKFAYEQANSERFLKRHVVSRICFAGIALAAIAARTLQTAIGALATTTSIVTLGYISSVNHIAYDCLGGPRILRDLFLCTLGFLHPKGLETIIER